MKQISDILEAVAAGRMSVEEAMAGLKWQPFEDLGFARVDHHRSIRAGAPEVIFCRGKRPEEVVEICRSLRKEAARVLCTRVERDQLDLLESAFTDLQYFQHARAAVIGDPIGDEGEGRYAAVISAGTADLPVAEEAAVTVRALGGRVRTVWDCGVAGIHRLIAEKEMVAGCEVAIVAAGMEGALPSVVGGLFGKPVIAVPTSVGYGASFGGLAALLGMLNSCASGVVTVNIDNGFGAGYFAAQMLRSRREG